MLKKLYISSLSCLILFSPVTLMAEEVKNEVKTEEKTGKEAFDVDTFYNEVVKDNATSKEKYMSLEANYGKMEEFNAESAYASYVQQLQKSKEKIDYDKKLSDIKNTDLSFNSDTLKQQFETNKQTGMREFVDFVANNSDLKGPDKEFVSQQNAFAQAKSEYAQKLGQMTLKNLSFSSLNIGSSGRDEFYKRVNENGEFDYNPDNKIQGFVTKQHTSVESNINSFKEKYTEAVEERDYDPSEPIDYNTPITRRELCVDMNGVSESSSMCDILVQHNKDMGRNIRETYYQYYK